MTSATHDSDASIASELVRDDPSFAELVEEFVAGMKDRLAQMENAIAGSDFESLRVWGHQLKGSGGGYGYPILTTRARALEQSAKDKSLADCRKAFEELKQVCARIVVSDAVANR